MQDINAVKKLVGEYAATLIKEGTTIGLGTGSTVYWLIQALGEQVKQGFHITVVPTSHQTEMMASELGIPIISLNDANEIALTIDGADEVDDALNLIKGGGAALLQEKMVAASSKELIIIVDESKMVHHLGAFPLPVEVIDFGWKKVKDQLHSLGCDKVEIRMKNDMPLITDHGHYLLDCYFQHIPNPKDLNIAIHLIPGVVETGLFVHMATKIITGYKDGQIGIKTSDGDNLIH